MRSRIRKALNVRANGPWIIAAALLVALMVAPFAGAFGEGNNVRGGVRNPSSDASRAYTKETQIIANLSTYGTRQSNKSNNGGGAVYGCRSAAGGTPKGNEPCVRASNLADGRAFEFNANGGTEVGAITGPAAAAPFTTTAKGVATGLNADQVDGKSADEITAAAQAKFATVTGAGALGDQRGATAAARSATGRLQRRLQRRREQVRPDRLGHRRRAGRRHDDRDRRGHRGRAHVRPRGRRGGPRVPHRRHLLAG